jgi:hypothetical protein
LVKSLIVQVDSEFHETANHLATDTSLQKRVPQGLSGRATVYVPIFPDGKMSITFHNP